MTYLNLLQYTYLTFYSEHNKSSAWLGYHTFDLRNILWNLCIDADPGPWDPCIVAAMDYRVLWRKRDCTATLSRGTSDSLGHSLKCWPLPWQAFILFLGTVHWGWSLFTMHRFSLGGYFLQKTKECLLITSKRKDICKCKGKSGWTGYTPPWKV